MSIRIRLHNRPASYTSLDVIAGSVVLYLQAPTTLSSITIKLEGESRTRLIGSPYGAFNDPRNRPARTELEVHKLLYKAETVFPTPDIQSRTGESSSFALSPGQYEYPFSLKIPINNGCMNNDSAFKTPTLGGLMLEMAREPNRHIKGTLPPSLSGFPGLAEIKYYLKATAVRPKFYQENLRMIQEFVFIPMEPPRPNGVVGEEFFARRSQRFSRYHQPFSKKSLFNKTTNHDLNANGEPPVFMVDARMPNPASLTYNQPLPLSILVKKTNQSRDTLFLSTLTIELFSFTVVRAHELTRTEPGSWILTSQANLQVPLGSSDDPVDKEFKLPKRYIDQIRIPLGVCPSFQTCNITRTYELEIRVGLRHGIAGNVKPELQVVPLRFPVTVYSGIAPPAALLNPTLTQSIPAQRPPQRPSPAVPAGSSYIGDHSPIFSPYSQQENYPPAQIGSYAPTSSDAPYDDAPPTYEEAVAEDIHPVDGPRPNYNPPPSPQPPQMPPRRPNTSAGGAPSSEKETSSTHGSSIYRMPSERLFPASTGDTASSSFASSSADPSSAAGGPATMRAIPTDQQEDANGLSPQQTGLSSSTDGAGASRTAAPRNTNPFRR